MENAFEIIKMLVIGVYGIFWFAFQIIIRIPDVLKIIFYILVFIWDLITGFLSGILCFIFAKQIQEEEEREKMDRVEKLKQEKANLLVEFEDLLKKKHELKKNLRDRVEKVNEFYELLCEVIDDELFEKENNFGECKAKHAIEKFDIDDVSIEELKDDAEELEKTTYRLFVVTKKLDLFDIRRDWRA